VGGVSANLFLNPTEIVRNKQNSYYPAKKSKYLQLDMTGKKLYYRCIQKSNLAPVDYLLSLRSTGAFLLAFPHKKTSQVIKP
jgi:hypothetical protein